MTGNIEYRQQRLMITAVLLLLLTFGLVPTTLASSTSQEEEPTGEMAGLAPASQAQAERSGAFASRQALPPTGIVAYGDEGRVVVIPAPCLWRRFLRRRRRGSQRWWRAVFFSYRCVGQDQPNGSKKEGRGPGGSQVH